MGVPANKLKFIRAEIIENCSACSGAGCRSCNKKIGRMIQYSKANIPVDYWGLAFKDFQGDPSFKRQIKPYLENLKGAYSTGTSLALVGKWGVGKTFVGCAILKLALMQGFSVKYFTMTEVISTMLSNQVDSSTFTNELVEVDFLLIDEFDKRYIYGSDKSEQLFGQTMEYILRARFSNQMPTILCSNTTEITGVVSGVFSDALDSLISKHAKVMYVAGKDFRKKKES